MSRHAEVCDTCPVAEACRKTPADKRRCHTTRLTQTRIDRYLDYEPEIDYKSLRGKKIV